jgi:hypothetical protein
MASRPRFVPSRPWRTGVVWAVGRHVFVHCPDRVPREVRLTAAEDGESPAGSLVDGSEVEVLAWRPRGAAGTRYRVRGRSGLVGWLSTGELRATPFAPPPPGEAAASVVDPRASVTRFGARR